MQKKVVCLLLVVIMMFAVMPTAFASEDELGNNAGSSSSDYRSPYASFRSNDDNPPASYTTLDADYCVWYGVSNFKALRYSVYFYEGAENFEDTQDANFDNPDIVGNEGHKIIQIGVPIYVYYHTNNYWNTIIGPNASRGYTTKYFDWDIHELKAEQQKQPSGYFSWPDLQEHIKTDFWGDENHVYSASELGLEGLVGADVYDNDLAPKTKKENLNLFYTGTEKDVLLNRDEINSIITDINNGNTDVVNYENSLKIIKACANAGGMNNIELDAKKSMIYGRYTEIINGQEIVHKGVFKIYYETVFVIGLTSDDESKSGEVWFFTLQDYIQYLNARSFHYVNEADRKWVRSLVMRRDVMKDKIEVPDKKLSDMSESERKKYENSGIIMSASPDKTIKQIVRENYLEYYNYLNSHLINVMRDTFNMPMSTFQDYLPSNNKGDITLMVNTTVSNFKNSSSYDSFLEKVYKVWKMGLALWNTQDYFYYKFITLSHNMPWEENGPAEDWGIHFLPDEINFGYDYMDRNFTSINTEYGIVIRENIAQAKIAQEIWQFWQDNVVRNNGTLYYINPANYKIVYAKYVEAYRDGSFYLSNSTAVPTPGAASSTLTSTLYYFKPSFYEPWSLSGSLTSNGNGYVYGDWSDPYETYSSIGNFFKSSIFTVACNLYLMADDDTINMKSIGNVKDGKPITDYNQYINSNTKSECDKDTGKFYLSSGVGIVTSLNGLPADVELKDEQPSLIKTFVRIKSIDASGNITFETAGKTVYQSINRDTFTDLDGNSKTNLLLGIGSTLTDYPKIEMITKFYDMDNIIENAALNDILTSPLYLHNAEEIPNYTWVDDTLLRGNLAEGKDRLDISTGDVNASLLDILLSNNTFLESIDSTSTINQILMYLTIAANKEDKDIKNSSDTFINLVNLFHISNQNKVDNTDQLKGMGNPYRDGTIDNSRIENLKSFLHSGMLVTTKKNGVDKTELLAVTEDNNNLSLYENDERYKDVPIVNTVILRYIEILTPKQIDIVYIFDDLDDVEDIDDLDKESATIVTGNPHDLDITDKTVVITNPELPSDRQVQNQRPVKFVTNFEYPLKDVSEGDLPDKSDNGIEGKSQDGLDRIIQNYPITPLPHNLYVLWIAEEPTNIPDDPGTITIPEWRLSRRFLQDKFEDKLDTGDIGLSFNLYSSHYVRYYDIYMYVSNSKIDSPYAWNYSLYIRDSIVSFGNWYNVKDSYIFARPKNFDDTVVDVKSDGSLVTNKVLAELMGVKTTDYMKLVGANWVDYNEDAKLVQFNVDSNSLPNVSNIGDKKIEPLNFYLSFNNNRNYINSYDYYTGTTYYNVHTDEEDCEDLRNGYSCSHSYTDYSSNYHSTTNADEEKSDAELDNEMTFNRYNAEYNYSYDFNDFIVKSIVEKGRATIQFDANASLKVYPEVGMLLEDENGTNSIQFVIGEQRRTINPIVWQTLQYKVFVTPISTGSSVATDTRAAQWLTSSDNPAYYRNLQVIYKGASVNNSFKISESSSSLNDRGYIEVKSYVIDINSNYSSLKSAWGNGSYNADVYHNALKNAFTNEGKMNTTEHLTIGASNYIGANVTREEENQGQFETLGNDVVKEYVLIVRGGKVIGIKVQNSSGTYDSIKIADVESMYPELYEALENMHLVGVNKSQSVLSAFEHKADNSEVLYESTYAEKLNAARQSIDGIATPFSSKVKVGKPWYSEDTTVLVVKEYTTKYAVPSLSVTDKISMSVKGLETPTNKNDFFSKMLPGYVYLKLDYNFTYRPVTAFAEKTVNAILEADSSKRSIFIDQKANYIVPNVSVTDSTRGG